MSDTELHERLQRVLRGLATGTDPGRLVNEVLAGTLACAKGQQGLVMGMVDGVPVPLASSGTPSAVLLEAAEGAIAAGRLTRRTAGTSTNSAAAEPIRVGDKVVGSLAVAGEAFSIDLAALPLFGSVAALVLARRPSTNPTDPVDVLSALATVYGEPDQASVLVHLFDAAEELFAARSGFCAVFEGDAVRIAHHRGVDRERLREATRHSEFRALLSAPGVRVDPPTHPVVARLATGLESAVGLPLIAAGRRLGHLVLLMGEEPDAATRAVLSGFAHHGALALRVAELYAAIGDTEERLSSVVHSMPNPVVVVDEEGRFTVINGSAAEAFSISETFEVGQPSKGRLGNATLETMLAGGLEGPIEIGFGQPAPRVYRATVRRVVAPGGRMLGRVLVLDDITSERETEQIKSDFVAVIGHELRTPITIMKSSVRTLERNGGEMAEASRARTLDALSRGVSRLERLIDDLLLISAVEQNRSPLELAPLDLGPLLDEFAGDRVVVRRPRRLDPLDGDLGKLRQVVHHLVDNALKYSEGPVTIEVSDGDEAVEVVVADCGPGIFSGDIPYLFERFRQLDGSATRNHGGTGLGLYICRRLVEAHGGRIRCESRLEVGSRFIFTLPRDRTAWPAPGRTTLDLPVVP